MEGHLFITVKSGKFVRFFLLLLGGGGGVTGEEKIYRKLAGRLYEYNSYFRGPTFGCFHQLY